MSNASRFHAVFSSRTAMLLILVLACLPTLRCDDSDGIINTSGPFSLRFSLGADFRGTLGGDPISWGLFRTDNGDRLASGEGVISTTSNPVFTLVTDRVMELGVPHEIHYWVDSNIDGGTPGVCDSETVDQQWVTRFAEATEDLVFLAVYKPELVQDVCDSFIP